MANPAHKHGLTLREPSKDRRALQCKVASSTARPIAAKNVMSSITSLVLSGLSGSNPSHADHPLSLADVYPSDRYVVCHACKMRCDSASQGGCNLDSYCCEKCNFSLHFGCAIATLPDQESPSPTMTKLCHFCHEHPLTSCRAETKNSIGCKVCSCYISGEVYCCYDCTFYLHKECARIPREIQQHPFHQRHALITPTSDAPRKLMTTCHACSGNSTHKIAYCCPDCRFNLHTE